VIATAFELYEKDYQKARRRRKYDTLATPSPAKSSAPGAGTVLIVVSGTRA
jgi:hypothetical protein